MKPPIENEDFSIRTFTNIDINLPSQGNSTFDGGVKIEGNYDNKTHFLGTIGNNNGPELSLLLKHNLFNHLNLFFNGSPSIQNKKGYLGASYDHPNFSVGSSLNYSSKEEFKFNSYDIWGIIKNQSISAGIKALFDSNHKNLDYVIGVNVKSGKTSESKPKFDLTFLIKNFKTYHLTYFQHFVTRRKIYNQFEEKHVTHITNYFDLGFEMIADEKDIDLKIAGSYQLNKNNMMKGRIDRERVQATYVLKTWFQPSLSFAATCGFNFKNRLPEYGIGVTLQNIFGADYERVPSDYEVTEIRNYRSEVAPNTELIDPRINITEKS